VSANRIPQNRTLGGTVDYSLHIIGALAAARRADECPLPDMNLDSDRGYGSHAWDWVRHVEADGPAFAADPHITSDPAENVRYFFEQPCTVPQGYNPDWSPSHTSYDFQQALRIHYLDPDAPQPKACDPKGNPIDPGDRRRAGIPPEGGQRG
jgi:hypothetical protein